MEFYPGSWRLNCFSSKLGQNFNISGHGVHLSNVDWILY